MAIINPRATTVVDFKELSITLPARPLATGAMGIEKKEGVSNEQFYSKSFDAIHKILQFWTLGRSQEVHTVGGFYVGEVIENGKTNFQVIPYVVDQSAKKQQWIVYINFMFSNIYTFAKRILLGSQADLERISDSDEQTNWNYHDPLNSKPNPLTAERVNAQLIVEGKHVDVLYDIRPVVAHQFLIISKKHPRNFIDLDKEAYIEANLLADKLISHFGKNGVVYRNFSNGSIAGQTVPEWHLKIMIVNSKWDEFFGYCNVALTMLGLKKPMTEYEVKQKALPYKPVFTVNH